jgi:hypothetical protein
MLGRVKVVHQIISKHPIQFVFDACQRTDSHASKFGEVIPQRVDVSGVVPKVAPRAGVRRPVEARESYRLAALRCHGASNKAKAAETVALQIRRRRPCVRLIVHGLRNPKGYHSAFRKVQGV